MTNKKSGGLGRGLSSILPDTKDFEMSNTVTAAISTIPLKKIVANPYQPRKEFAPEALEELAQSIRQQGVITPVTVRIVQTRLNPKLSIEGLLITMYDNRLRLARQVVEDVRGHFKHMVFDTLIYRNTKLAEAPSYGKSIIMHDAASTGAVNYLNLAQEILKRNSK